MEHAVVRGAGRHPTRIADRVLIGPHAHVTGADVAEDGLIATHATVFSGARIGAGCTVAIGAIVHVMTAVPPDTLVPMQHMAVGDPSVIYSPEDARAAHRAVVEAGFTLSVFGHDTRHLTMRESNDRATLV